MIGDPEVLINGRRLNGAQVLTLRAALDTFALELVGVDYLGEDALGRGIAEGYRARLGELLALIHGVTA